MKGSETSSPPLVLTLPLLPLPLLPLPGTRPSSRLEATTLTQALPDLHHRLLVGSRDNNILRISPAPPGSIKKAAAESQGGASAAALEAAPVQQQQGDHASTPQAASQAVPRGQGKAINHAFRSNAGLMRLASDVLDLQDLPWADPEHTGCNHLEAVQVTQI
jgi:hypothetical protein